MAATDNTADIAFKTNAAINAAGLFITSTRSGTDVTISGNNTWQTLDYSTYSFIGDTEFLNRGLDGATLATFQEIVVTGQVELPD